MSSRPQDGSPLIRGLLRFVRGRGTAMQTYARLIPIAYTSVFGNAILDIYRGRVVAIQCSKSDCAICCRIIGSLRWDAALQLVGCLEG